MINIEDDFKAEAQTEETAEAENIEEVVEEEKSEDPAPEGGEETGEGDAPEEAAPEQEDKKEPDEEESLRYMRLMAEFQNYKKRVDKEKKDLYQYANEKIVTELLAVLDNFERALEQEADASFKEGMELIFKQLNDVLEKSGLAEIKALGEEFDPNFHNAVMTETSEEYESGKVSGVLQKGYTLNGKVIRPSMVKVVG